MKSRHEVLASYAKEKENDFKKLEQSALKHYHLMGPEELIEFMKQAYYLGHYVGHIRGEQFQSSLLESYKQALYEADQHRYGNE